MKSTRRANSGYPGRLIFAYPDTCIHDRRAETRIRNRVFDICAVCGHRHGGRVGPYVHGHDDAAADHHRSAIQIDIFCNGGWLELNRGQFGSELWALDFFDQRGN